MTPTPILRSQAPGQPSAVTGSSQSRTPSRRNSLSTDVHDPASFATFNEKLSKASELLNADKPREALALLAPCSGEAEAKNHYGYQSRLGNAYMGVADELVAANQLGSFLVAPDSSGSWLKPTLHAERVSCYIGVLGSYGRLLEILKQPDQRARLVEKNSQETLQQVESGVRHGITHARLEPVIFLNRISQINSNKASQSFVKRSLELGQLKESDPVVRSFREVEADPLYQPIAAATDCIHRAVEKAGMAPQMFWFEWFREEKQKLLDLPEFRLTQDSQILM